MSECDICNNSISTEGKECPNCGWDLENLQLNFDGLPDEFGGNKGLKQKVLDSVRKVYEKLQQKNQELQKKINELEELEKQSNPKFPNTDPISECQHIPSQSQEDNDKSLDCPTPEPQNLDDDLEASEEITDQSEKLHKELESESSVQQISDQEQAIRENQILIELRSRLEKLEKNYHDQDLNKEVLNEDVKDKLLYLELKVLKIEETVGNIQKQSSNSQSSQSSDCDDEQILEHEEQSVTKKTESSINSDPEELKFVDFYNQNPDNRELTKLAAEANITSESLMDKRAGANQNLIFELVDKNKGTYWIFKSSSPNGFYYLTINKSKRINSNSYQTIAKVFECYGVQSAQDYDNFQLVKPARVSRLPTGDKYLLEKQGQLQFN